MKFGLVNNQDELEQQKILFKLNQDTELVPHNFPYQ
jgi:hypothetical protein